jgi:hypothetical protein
LSRHRKIQFSRSKAILVAAGALSIATAASATTTTWATGSAGPVRPSGHAEATGLIAVRAPAANGVLQLAAADQLPPQQADVAYQLTGVTLARASQIRAAAMQYAVAQRTAAQQRLAKNAAAARAAAARAAALVATADATATAATASQSPAPLVLSASPRPTATATALTRPAVPRPTATATAPARPAPRPTAAATAPARSGSPQQIAEAMLGSFGWSSGQFACLDPLWARESGWRVTAENPSGAYGIPQALPGSKMASAGPDWQTSAATQIEWGLGYIKGIYGSPCAAWDHEQATGWY